MNLRIKFIIPVILALLMFTLVVHYYWRPILLEQERADIIAREGDVLRGIVPSLLRDILTGNLAGVHITLDRLREINKDEDYYIELLNANGKRIYPLTPSKIKPSPHVLKLDYPLNVDGHFMGTIFVEVDGEMRHKEIEAQIGGIEITAFILFGFLLLVILFLQEWLIMRPLIVMKRASRKLVEGDFESVLPIHNAGEVGDLARTFDHMRKNILQTRDALKREANEAERANQAKSEFLSHMSHELRTPMNAILGFGQMLELDAVGFTKTQKENVKEILSAGNHLLDLINDVLDLARIESGKFEIDTSEVPIAGVVKQCIMLIATQSEQLNLELIDNVSDKGHSVQVDTIRCKQVLLNILSNAVKYNRKNGRIILDSEVMDNHRLRISITDCGHGLTKNQISKLFIPFERLGDSNNVEGTGIGLVITKYLVEMMGGGIGVECVPGEGCTFWVEFVLVDEADDFNSNATTYE